MTAGRWARFRELAVRWGPALLWMMLIFALSSQPGLRVSDDRAVDLPIRHAAHVAAYAVLGLLLIRALIGPGRGWSSPRAALGIVIATLYGVSDEVHQAFVPDRAPTLIDVCLDALGALLGSAVLAVLRLARASRNSVSDPSGTPGPTRPLDSAAAPTGPTEGNDPAPPPS
jgi:VanZ family protein